MKVLIVGSGGREHGIAWALSRDPDITEVFATPGNPGIAECAKRIEISPSSQQELAAFAKEKNIDLVVVGPEAHLAAGIVDVFLQYGLRVFGPTKAAARLETSKGFTKKLCNRMGVPCPRWVNHTNLREAVAALDGFKAPWVIKADGLAGGKGVTVTSDKARAVRAVEWCLARTPHAVVIEEFIDGWEATVMASIAGERVCWMTPIYQDSKRLLDGDRGPNTGGMGPFMPVPQVTSQFVVNVLQKVLAPLAKGLSSEGSPFFGMMSPNILVPYGSEEPYLLECNARFGDPEIQSLTPFIKGGLASHLFAVASNAATIKHPSVVFTEETSASVTVVVASKGYPDSPALGSVIALRQPRDSSVVLFHAGTAHRSDGALITAGGRVLNVVGVGSDVRHARKKAYAAVEECISFSGMYYRSDIGLLGATERRPLPVY